MMQFTVTLSDEEALAMSTICGDTQQWVENALRDRARIAMDAIVDTAVTQSLQSQTVLPATKAEIVSFAVQHGWVKTFQDVSTRVVPGKITMRQARLALLAAGKLNEVALAINLLGDVAKEAAQIEWEYSSEVQRHNGFVSLIGPALCMTEEQIDDLFIAASKL